VNPSSGAAVEASRDEISKVTPSGSLDFAQDDRG
jgi:hypothetical protein